jgi:taurine dioxygenase
MLDAKPLTVGIEVSGIDLREPFDAGVGQELRRLAADHQLLVFRDQELDVADQVRAAAIFGNVLDEKQDGQFHQYVSGYETAISPGRLLFHSDNHHTLVPLEYLTLYAERVDSHATPTLFLDNVAAFKRLPECLLERLASAETVTMTFFHLGSSDRPSWSLGSDNAGGPSARHPAIWKHPDTAAPFVYLTELHTNHIVGIAREESDSLLRAVFDIMYDDRHFLEHVWRTGDLLVWNNRTVQHARADIADAGQTGAAARKIRRVGVGLLSFSDQYKFSSDTRAEMSKVVDNYYVDSTQPAN